MKSLLSFIQQSALMQFIARRRLSELAWLLLFSALIIRAVGATLGAADWLSYILLGILAAGLLWLRLGHPDGIPTARAELGQSWERFSRWLALAGWGRMLAFSVFALAATSLLAESIFGSYAHEDTVFGLIFALIAAKIALGIKPEAPHPDAAEAQADTTRPVCQIAVCISPDAAEARTDTPAAPRTSVPRRIAMLSWGKLGLLGLLLLLMAAITDSAFTSPSHRLSTTITTTKSKDSTATGQSEPRDTLQIKTPGKNNVSVKINDQGISIDKHTPQGVENLVTISGDGIKTEVAEQSAATQSATADDEADKPDEVDADDDSRIKGFSFASLAMIAILSMIAVKVLAGGKHRAEQDADTARTAEAMARLAREASDAKLSAMQAQIEPHFLFNTLASVEQLIQTDPARASKVQKSLIQYLRGAIPQIRDDAQRSTLGRQMDMSNAYLEIMQVRMEERLQYDFEISEGLRSAEFPSMMLQTLIENAIKHGLEPKPEGGVLTIRAEVARGRLVVQVEDTGMGYDEEKAAQGLGLANIRERLKLMYGPQAASLNLKAREGGGAIAEIAIPYRDEGDKPATSQETRQ
ncbi:sensor histidine kinase [Uliginosibacterium gangwonense]|uniref:sensor histidine kinase n=1 Tax=Uliginosibacterium gangwonense TaxID=392736 RepID=UPI0003790A1F|nr:histidine kinase [Uliginosibacterium gangwonense]